jgi:hypothetical protein
MVALKDRSVRSLQALDPEGIHPKDDWFFGDSDEISKELDFLSPEQKQLLDSKILEQRDGLWYRDKSFVESFSSNEDEAKLLSKYLRSRHVDLKFGTENVRVLRKLIKDPEYIHEEGALREILTALSYAFDGGSVTSERQYHMAVIFDNKTFGFKAGQPNRYRHWASFYDDYNKVGALSPEEKGNGILAAVSLSRLKEESEEMRQITESSGPFAHPIFQMVGVTEVDKNTQRAVLRWPKEVSK